MTKEAGLLEEISWMIKTKIITRPKYEKYEFEFDIEHFSNQLNRKIIDIQYTSNSSNYEAIITYEV